MERNLIIFASGTPTDGGTGAENLVKRLPGRTLAVVSNHKNGGVWEKAKSLGVHFAYFPGPYTEEGYGQLVEKICTETNVDKNDVWFALSGWFKKVHGLSPARTFNIHPAPLPQFAGIYGEKLHVSVWEAYKKGEIREGEIVMQFVVPQSPKYDDGPIFFRYPFLLSGIGSYESYRTVVRTLEHAVQPFLADLVMRGEISWDGIHPESLKVPEYL